MPTTTDLARASLHPLLSLVLGLGVGGAVLALAGDSVGLPAAIVVALLGLVLMLRGWARRAHETAADAGPAEPLLNRRIVITMALSLVYAGLLIGRAPFWLVTALFIAAFVAFFAPADAPRARRATVALLAGVLTSTVVTLVFQYVFLVRLP